MLLSEQEMHFLEEMRFSCAFCMIDEHTVLVSVADDNRYQLTFY